MDRFKAREGHGPLVASPGLEPFWGWWAVSSLWPSARSKASGHLSLCSPLHTLPASTWG